MNFVAQTCAPVAREQDEWSAVEWFLRMTYRSSCISVRSLWSVSNPGLSHQFSRRSVGKQVMRSIILGDDLPLDIRQICERGLQQAALRVVIGNQLLPGASIQYSALTGSAVRKRSSGRRVYEALIFQVAPGTSQTTTHETANVRDIPSDYDSYLIRSESEPEMATIENEQIAFLAPSAFKQTYLLKDGSQALPEFVVHFEVNDDQLEAFALPPCANCERAAATVWCIADEAALCGHCDEVEHAENKIAARHQRVPINERLISKSVVSKCALVPSETACLWDPTLGLALSRKAVDEALVQTGPLVELLSAYKSSVKAARREDAVTATLKKSLMTQVQTLNDELRAVAREKEEADMRINSVADTAMNRAAEIAKERSTSLLASQENLSHQLEFVQWAMAVLVPLEDRLSPTDWLRLWTNLNRLAKEKIDKLEPFDSNLSDPFIIHLQASLRVNSN
jgi:hypothetical protein